MLRQILDELVVIGTFINQRKLNFHPLLAFLTMNVEL
jgi:hypothetical protein